jgi:tRNA(Met) cytidine acetyltransferase
MSEPLLNWINTVYQANKQTGRRAAIVLSGDSSFCINTVRRLINYLSYDSIMWVSSEMEHAVSPAKARMLLGKECDALVFDACHEFDIDAFGAVSGTVKAEGMLFLLVPDNKASYLGESRFFKRALNNKRYSNVYFISKNSELPVIQQNQNSIEPVEAVEQPYRTLDQKHAVQAIVELVAERDKGVIVLTSDRGRGKSSSLGLAAGILLQKSIKKIMVTAPRLANSDAVFYHAQKTSSGIQSSPGKINLNDACVEFIAPDFLLEKQPSMDVIFVDEASAIPLPMLEKILDVCPRVVFSSTIHGYEGTGRGFALKFNQILDAKRPGWKTLELDMPVRWIKNDPVEAWIDSILCLNAELEYLDRLDQFDIDKCSVQCIDRDELVKDESKLSALFALLVHAHYRTQPSDFVYLLDSDSVRVYTLEQDNKILAATLISEEGGFEKSLCSEVYRGERRPQGHLLAQTLSFHGGVESAASLKYARVMRIAVHPELQRQGVGSHLLQQVASKEQALGMDAIGSSFGATVELLSFWNKLNFGMVRIGFTRDHASGTHSAVMLKVLNKRAEEVFVELRSKFGSYIADWLAEALIDLPSDMKQYLESESRSNGVEIADYEWADIQSFARTHRGYEVCMPALKKLINKEDKLMIELSDQQQIIIDTKINKMKPWSDVVKESGVTGKAQAIEYLKKAVKNLLPAQ